jgi:hypothetical protein
VRSAVVGRGCCGKWGPCVKSCSVHMQYVQRVTKGWEVGERRRGVRGRKQEEEMRKCVSRPWPDSILRGERACGRGREGKQWPRGGTWPCEMESQFVARTQVLLGAGVASGGAEDESGAQNDKLTSIVRRVRVNRARPREGVAPWDERRSHCKGWGLRCAPQFFFSCSEIRMSS